MMLINIFQVLADEAQDEMAPYFNRETTPKILITTTDRPSAVSCISFSHHKKVNDAIVLCRKRVRTLQTQAIF